MKTKAKIGEKKNDMVIIEVNSCIDILVECSVCKRKKKMIYSNFSLGKGTSHKWCSKLVERNEHFYGKWANLRARTTIKSSSRYEQYGGRGISSDKWKYFIDFYDDMYESYLNHVAIYGEKETTIERIDVNGDYCKENCKWATWKEQHGNTTRNKEFIAISPNGEIFYSKNLHEFAKNHNLTATKICECLNKPEKHFSHKGWKFKYKHN